MLGPIFVREWLTVPRRPQHYVQRASYLGLLWILALTAWQTTVGWTRPATLGDTARFGGLMFQVLTFVQLLLFLFFAALSGASAVAHEKDRRTFVLLLMTDLRNYEIVLGKLFGSLLQILLLLLATVPVLAFTLLLGGVSGEQILQAVLVLTATGLGAGSLGVLIALWRERTFQSLALTVLCLVLYFCLVWGGRAASLWAGVSPGLVNTVQGWFDPIAALLGVLKPEPGELPAAYAFTAVMLGVSVLLNGWGILRLRVWNPSGEPIMQREGPGAAKSEEEEDRDRIRAHAAPGQAREVWANPILWREVRTRGYGRRPLLVKTAYFLVLALICVFAFAALPPAGSPVGFAAAFGLVPVGVLSLLLVGAQAVTAITTERDTGALDLLLVTDLSPQEFIFGKILGILYNTKEYLLPPLILAAVYFSFGALATPPRNHPELLVWRNAESLTFVLLNVAVLMAFALVLGIHVALRNHDSRQAIVQSLGTVFFLSAGTLVAIYLILINSGRFEYQWTSFVFFLAAGIGGLWWVLNADRPSAALTWASIVCPLAVYYTVINVMVARPGSEASTDPLIPGVVLAGAFGFAIAAMLVPLLSEFDVALGRTSAPGEG